MVFLCFVKQNASEHCAGKMALCLIQNLTVGVVWPRMPFQCSVHVYSVLILWSTKPSTEWCRYKCLPLCLAFDQGHSLILGTIFLNSAERFCLHRYFFHGAKDWVQNFTNAISYRKVSLLLSMASAVGLRRPSRLAILEVTCINLVFSPNPFEQCL